MKRNEFLRTAVLGGGAVLWAPRSFGQTSAISSRAPWILPHVRRWPHPPHHPIPHPPVRPWRSPVEIGRVGVEVSVSRQVATTTMVIALRNPADAPQEGRAILPVPHGAMLKSFSMEGGGHKITAELLPCDEARRIYDSIVARLRDPALLEFAGLAAVKSSVFPVPAHGTVRLRMVYEELLEAEGDQIDYVLPRSESLDSAVPWSIRVDWLSNRGLADIYSPSHEIEKRRVSKKRMEITVRDSRKPGPFRLSALMRGKDGVAAGLLTHPEDSGPGGWFLLLLTPPERRVGMTLPREVTLVLDRSGSMAGEKLDQARAAALQVVEGLDDGEWFNLIVYNESVERFAEKPVKVTRASVLRARQWIQALRVSGGTNIHGALEAAVGQPARPGALPIVLFLTDGLPTIGETSEKRIRKEIAARNHAKRRIFTFGVGVDVNTPLLSRLADDTRATASIVLPGENVEVEVAKVFERLSGPSLAEPVLAVLDRDGNRTPGRITDVIPARLPDFYENEQVVVAGRWTGRGPLRFRMEGHDAGGKGKLRRFHFTFKPNRKRHPFVPRLWATRKIAILTEALRDLGADGARPDRDDPRIRELVGEIVRLSTRYGVMSEYTAFLARDGAAFDPVARRESVATDALISRAVAQRSGAGAANQESNLWRQKQAVQLNPTNGFLNAKLEQEEVREVRQVADKAFYRRANEWVDADLLENGADAPVESVAIGTKEFHTLVDRLVAEDRQSCLALGPGTRIEIDGKCYLVK
jgi:Ca-activated chloride channel family protein